MKWLPLSVRRGPHLLLVVMSVPVLLLAQSGAPPIDFSPKPRIDQALPQGIPDSIVKATVAAYNAATSRLAGDYLSRGAISGSLGVFEGDVNLSGSATGDIIIINGNLHLASTARIQGRVVVLGGRLTTAPGATMGDTLIYVEHAPVERERDGTLTVHRNRRSLSAYATASYSNETFAASVRLTPGSYNRVEGLSLQLRPSALLQLDDAHTLRVDLLGIARTATAVGEERNNFGWRASIRSINRSPLPLTLGLQAGNLITATQNQPFSLLESSLSAMLFRRDLRDWYRTKYWGVTADLALTRAFGISGGLSYSRDQSVRTADAFSLLRSSEAWRPNPLIDDGRYTTATVGLHWDTRDDPILPSSGSLVRMELRRTTSNSITPVSLPASIRGDIPATHYRADEIDFDLRRYWRLNPTQALHFRVAGGGWIGGDPLTMQRRRAIGGGDPLAGYQFRAINCERRLRADAAQPALCDRDMVAQLELRQALPFDLNTRIAGRDISLQRPDLVVLLNSGSAWLAGDGVGRVPSQRVQSFEEWRSSVGLGLDTGVFGFYLTKAVADPEPFRFMLRIFRHF